MHLHNILAAVRSNSAWRAVRPWSSWWIWVPLGFGMGMLFSTGPAIQHYVVALITSDEVSIYGSSFQHSAVKLPSLSDWFSTTISWPFPFMGIVVAVLSVNSSSLKVLFFRFALFSFLILLAFDITYGLAGGNFSAQDLFTDALANFFGGILASGTAVLTMMFANYGYSALDEASDISRRSFSAALVLVASLTTFLVTFFVVDFLYRPRPVDVVIATQNNAHGFIMAKEAPKGSRTSELESLSPALTLLSEVNESGGLNWRMASNATIRKAADPDAGAFDIEVSLFRGCLPAEGPRALPTDPAPYTVRGVKTFSLRHDWSFWDTTVTADNSKGSVTMSGTDASSFVTKADRDGQRIEIQQIADTGTTVKYSSGMGDLNVFAIAPPGRADAAMAITPMLHLEIDQKTYSLQVDSAFDPNSAIVSACAPLDTASAFEKGRVSLGHEGILGVRVKIAPVLDATSPHMPDNSLEFKGDSGWVTALDIPSETLTSRTSKRVDMIALGDGVTSVSVNGSDRDVRAGDSYVAVGGDLYGSFRSGSLDVRGKAAILWVNSSRANPTKWEVLPIEYRVGALGGALTIFGLLVRFIAQRVNGGIRLEWLEETRSNA